MGTHDGPAPRRGPNRWRCGESNPGPLRLQRRHLRAQPTASFRAVGLCRQVSLRPIQNCAYPAGPGTPAGAAYVGDV